MTHARLSRHSLILVVGAVLFAVPILADTEGKEEDDSNQKKGLSLEATRTIALETAEGTWISLDVAPDGKSIVFDLLGDLHTVPVEGGSTKRITEGMAFDSQPVFSPDGKWIAFLSDRNGSENVWICRPDGTEPKVITKGKRDSYYSPAWTPDSRYIVTGKGGKAIELWMYHIEGGSGVAIEERKEGEDEGNSRSSSVYLGPVISPDGRFLYYSKRDAKSVYNQLSFDWDIYRRDMVSGDEDRVTQAGFGAFRPVLSPDGKQLVYGTRFDGKTGLRIRDLDSGRDRWLKYPIQRDDMESRASQDLFPGYSFTPDGTELLVTNGGKIWRVNVATGVEEVIPFVADASQAVGPLLNFQHRVDEGPVRSRLIRFPTQSPDGDSIVFSAMAKIYVMSLADRKPRRLTQSEAWEFKPSWSPDGRWVTYVTWNDQAEGHIWKAPVDGSDLPQRLSSTPSFYTDPVFAPDGSRIVARRGNSWMRSQTPSEFGGLRISLDLVWLPTNGGETTLIVPARGLGTPHFGPENDRIYFYSSKGLVSLRYDGTDRRTHAKILGKKREGGREPEPADQVQISPDGQWALAKVSNQLYLIAVPGVGGEGVSIDVFSPQVPVQRLTSIGVDSFAWADKGKVVSWSVGSTFFRRPLASISFDEGKAEKKGDSGALDDPDAERKEPKKERKSLEEHESIETFEAVIEFPRYKPEGVILLRGATVLTMHGGQVVEDADLLIKDNRIQALGKRGSIRIPPDSREVDLKGKYVLPGFVDTHAHYEMRTEGVLELHNWSFVSNLAYGVTTGLDVQTSTNDYLTYQDLVEAGMMLGPRAYSTGPGVFSDTDLQSAAEAYWILDKYKEHYRNNNLKSYMVGSRKQRQWVAQAARELELTVTTEGGLDLKMDLTHVIDGFGGNEHALPIVPLFNDVVQLFAQSKTAYTPTLLVLYGGPFAENMFYQTTEVHSDPKLNRFVQHNDLDQKSRRGTWFHRDEHVYPMTASSAGMIQRAGGFVGVGGHGQLQGLGYHWEMWALAEGVMTPEEVLKAATIDGAYIIGLEPDLGSVEVGKLADLVILEKDPRVDIRNTNSIRFVMKNGELFEGETMKQIFPEEKALPPFWWWSELPSGE